MVLGVGTVTLGGHCGSSTAAVITAAITAAQIEEHTRLPYELRLLPDVPPNRSA